MSKTQEINQPVATSAKTKAFPSTDEVEAWGKLSAREKRAIVEADEEAGFQSGVAPKETAAEHIARVRASS